jgi:transposase
MDGRKLSHEAREEIRVRAVRRVEAGESPEAVIQALGFHRSCIYEWLARYREGGYEGLRYRKIPGRKPKLSGAELQKLYRWVTSKDPRQLKFEFALWTRAMVRELIRREFGVRLSVVSVGRLLKKLGLSPQRPLRRAYQQDSEAVERWKSEEFPAIRQAARKAGAILYFGDESAVRSDYHSGTTWAPKGKTPVVRSTGARFSLNLISAVSAQGHMRFMTVDGRLNAPKFIAFLKRLLVGAEQPVFLIVDRHPVHRSAAVRNFVDATEGQLRLFFLPSYSPELNPDELVWNHVKNHGVGRMTPAGPDQLKRVVLNRLRSLQKLTRIIQGFFRHPETHYTLQPSVG